MELPHEMTTLSHILNKLQERGVDRPFKWVRTGFTVDGVKIYQPHELTIVKVYRFEEMKDPSDLCVLYLIQGSDGITGYIIDTYGVYSNYNEEGFENAIRLIPEKDHQEQLLFQL